MVLRKQNQINVLLQEKGILQLIIRRRDNQIAEYRRIVYRWTVRYNDDVEIWRKMYADLQTL